MLSRWSLLLSIGLFAACAEVTADPAHPEADSGALHDPDPPPNATPDATPTATPDATQNATPNATPDATPDLTPPFGDSGTPERDASSAPDAGAYVALGMNDVTILAPPPASDDDALMRATDLMDDGTPLVPRALFDRLNDEPIAIFGAPIVRRETYEGLQLVAVRFELCDRNRPGPCSASADGRLRLVLQPHFNVRDGFEDVGLHAFFSIPAAEIVDAVRDLRALARIQAAPLSAPLDVNPALTAGNAAYADALRGLVRRIAGEKSFVRLTFNAQPSVASQVRWAMRGVEMRDGVLAGVVIPNIAGSTEEVITSGHGFAAQPMSDTPKGMLEVINDRSFAAASAERKLELLAVLAAAENPNLSAPDTVSCIACHVSTQVTQLRAGEVGADPTAIEGRFTSSYDLAVQGTLRTNRTTRALGWLHHDKIISQRVVNDTAQLLLELETRFPP